jgi:osmotically-inducible protein OsmY
MSEHEYLVGRVQEALAHEGETDVHVQVSPGHLLVTGNVATDERRRTVVDITRGLAGELAVHDHVTVLHCREPDGEEHLGPTGPTERGAT